MDVLGALYPSPVLYGALGPAPTRKSLYLQDSQPEPPPTVRATVDRARFLRDRWKDGLRAQLSEGWKTFQSLVPTQASLVTQVSDAAGEQADAAILKLFDATFAKAIPAVEAAEKKFGAKARAEGQAALEEMKRALLNQQGQIDPTSDKAFSFIESVLTGTPVSQGLSAAQVLATKVIHDTLNVQGALGPLVKTVTDLYYGLHGTAKSVATVLLAGAMGAAAVASGLQVDPQTKQPPVDGFIFVPPAPLVVSLAPWLPQAQLSNLSMSKGELTRLSTGLSQVVGKSGLSLTAAADYKKGNPLFLSGGVKYTTVLPKDVSLTASGTVQAPTTTLRDTAFTARADVQKTLGKKKDLDLSAYAQVQKSAQARAEGAAGVQLTQRFGADPARAAARQAKKDERRSRVAERKAARQARRSHRPNPSIARQIAGPLPTLTRLYPAGRGVSQPYLTPPPSAGFAWGWALGTAGALGLGVWWWRHSARRGA